MSIVPSQKWRGWIENVYLVQQPTYRPTDQEALVQYLTSYPWQAWFTGSGEPDSTCGHLDKLVGRWRSHLAHLSGLQVAAIGVFNPVPQPHVHVLLLGRNKYGKTLADISAPLREQMDDVWEWMSFRPGRLAVLDNPEGVVNYIVGKNIIDKPSTILSPRGIKLLKRIKTPTI